MKTIKARRELLGLTQQALAELMGTTQQTIARWETSQDVPSKHLGALATVLCCSVQELLKGPTTPAGIRKSIEHESLPWGGVAMRFRAAGEVRDEDVSWYPVDDDALAELKAGIEAGGAKWVRFVSLDNRRVAVNLAHVLDVQFTHDDVEAMPRYEHAEVYSAAAAMVSELDQRLPADRLPTAQEIQEESFPFSQVVAEKALELIESLGGKERANEYLNRVTVHFSNGTVEHLYATEDLVMHLEDEFLGMDDEVPDGFVDVSSDDSYEERYIKRSAIRLIEVPLTVKDLHSTDSH